MTTGGIWLITSSAFVDQELSAEFGHLPPAFLPVGTRRIVEFQLEVIGGGLPIYITVPESYDLFSEDKRRFDEAGVTVLPVPDGLSLGDAVVFALNLIGGPDQPVRILHGDTLISAPPPVGLDQIGVALNEEGYSWAEASLDGEQRLTGLETFAAGVPSSEQRLVACGYFSFAHSTSLLRGIVRSRGDFLKGILRYNQEFPIAAVHIPDWLDFGHLQTFFRSRRLLASARSFNTLRIDGFVVRKLSADRDKMAAEAEWFSNLPSPLRIYTARLIDKGEDEGLTFYETEYEYLPTLAELFVFGTLSRNTWIRILHSCSAFLTKCAAVRDTDPSQDVLRQLTVVKTMERLETFATDTDFDITRMLRYDGRALPSLLQIAQDIEHYIDLTPSRGQNVMHGDFCFSNVLYSSRVQRIRVVDPRGYIKTGANTIMGDVRYDLAKLLHSVVGRYDQIIAGRYAMSADDSGRYTIEFENAPHHMWLNEALQSLQIAGIPAASAEIRAITVGLFLSMLPLHADRPDRQRAFIANALRLYSDLDAAR